MVACICPKPGKTITDPACGTGGFFLAARLPDRPVELRTRQRPERIPEARDLSPTRQHARSRHLPDGGHYLQLRVHGIISALGIRHAGLRYNVRQIFASRTPEIVSAGRCGCRPQGVTQSSGRFAGTAPGTPQRGDPAPRVVRIFPNREGCLRLLRALAVETLEDRLGARRPHGTGPHCMPALRPRRAAWGGATRLAGGRPAARGRRLHGPRGENVTKPRATL